MQFVYEKMPDTLEEFKNMENFSLKDPHSTSALFMLALCKYVENKALGIEMINLLKGPIDLTKYEENFISDRISDKLYLPYSYFDGATVENNYTPTLPLTVRTYEDNSYVEPGYVKVLLSSSGADSKRFITLRKKADEYYIWEYPGILSGIRIPKNQDPWA